jgi:tellurite resistance protein
MTSEEEEKYFEAKQAEWRSDIRRDKRLEAIQQEELEGVAEELNTSEDVAEEALNLGFDQETARVLPLVPLVEMAWADGTVSRAERNRVRELATNFGIDPDSEAFDFLELMLTEQPSDVFFDRVNRVVVHLTDSDPDTWDYETLVDLLESVAEASGGFFGLTNPINSDERAVLRDIAEYFEVESSRAEDILPDED